MIYLVSGRIRSGKTTALFAWLAGRKNAAGFLCPDIDGLRRLYDIRTREYFPFQAYGETGAAENCVRIGRFTFYQSAFERAADILADGLKCQCRALVIDEIGRLELNDLGFGPMVRTVIGAHQTGEFRGDVVCVVRDTLVKGAVGVFGIKQHRLILSNNLQEIG